MALPVFETTFINNVVEAMTKALELSIISGTGSGQPKGILKETVAEGQNIDVAAGGKLEYQTLIAAEASLPLAYENGAVWFMTKKTFMSFVGMVDTNGQPIARVNYGINGQADRSLSLIHILLKPMLNGLSQFRRNGKISRDFQQYCVDNKVIINIFQPDLRDYLKSIDWAGYKRQMIECDEGYYLKVTSELLKEYDNPKGFIPIPMSEFYKKLEEKNNK